MKMIKIQWKESRFESTYRGHSRVEGLKEMDLVLGNNIVRASEGPVIILAGWGLKRNWWGKKKFKIRNTYQMCSYGDINDCFARK